MANVSGCVLNTPYDYGAVALSFTEKTICKKYKVVVI